MAKHIPVVGSKIPDFTALDTEGKRCCPIQELVQSANNVMLVFYRGHW